MSISADVYGPTYAAQKRVLDVVVHRATIEQLRREYLDAQREIAKEILFLVQRHRSILGVLAQRAISARLHDDEMKLAVQFTKSVVKANIAAQQISLATFFEGLDALDVAHGGRKLDRDEAEVYRAAKMRQPEIERLVREPLVKLLAEQIRVLETRIGGAMITGNNLEEAIKGIVRLADQEWWKIERIIRTMTAWAFNTARADAFDVLHKYGLLYMRWTELVDDATGKPKDDRVGTDSIVLHGQVVQPGELFTMPPDSRLDRRWWLKTWAHPPNRPNDRSVLVPWRPGWNVPAWRWNGSEREPIR